MNLLQPWNIVFLVLLLIYFRIRGLFVQRLNLMGQKKELSRFDRLEKILLFGMSIGVLFLPVLYLFTPLLSFADYKLPAIVPWFGVTVMVISLWLFWRSHADLGKNWSVSLELREDHQIVRDGVYRHVRHPMYSSIWLWSIAQGMMLQNWLAGWSTLIAFIAMYFLRMPREERMMCEKFGDQYRQYMQQTGRLFPRFKKNDGGLS